MINFRFHLVSLVAVFLALAVGVVMGYGILGQPTVSGLQSRIDAVEANAEARRLENTQLQTDLDRAEAALEESSPFSATSRLPSVPAVVVAVRDVDGEAVQRVVRLTRRAGATVPGIVWLEGKLALASKDDVAALATALDLPQGTKRATARDAGWSALIDRLGNAPSVGPDVLGRLVDAGFVSIEGVDRDAPAVSAVGGTGSRIIFAVGAGTALKAAASVKLFASAAVDAGVPLVVGEVFPDDADEATRGVALVPVTEDEALAAKVSTVDDLEWSAGAVAAVVGLSDLGRGVVGHYGFGAGAQRLLPEWSQP